MAFAYLTYAAAVTALAQRLGDPSLIYWNQPSQLLNLVIEAARLIQALTGSYKQTITFNTQAGQPYYSLTDFPALRNVATDVEVANNVLAVLLEPPLPATGTWTGTGQFTFAQLQNALQSRLNRFIGETGRHVVQQQLPFTTPNQQTLALPDGTLDVRRAAWVPAALLQPVLYTGTASVDGLLVSYVSGPVFTQQMAGLLITINGQTVIVESVPSAAQLAVSASLGIGGPYTYTMAAPVATLPLGRIDEWAEQSYQPDDLLSPGLPVSYSVFGQPPVTLSLIPPPALTGAVDLISVQSGPQVNLSVAAPVVLGIPDDCSAGLKYGVLAELFGADGQSRDYARAQYCEQRYREYVQVARIYPSVLTALINLAAAGIGSVFDLDSYMPDWQQSYGQPTFVGMCGRHLACVGRVPDDGTAGGAPGNNYAVQMYSVANMPVPAASDPTGAATFIQLGRDLLDPMLDYAQHAASLQMAGAEFSGTDRMFQNAIGAAKSQNGRLEAIGFYKSQMDLSASKGEHQVVRMLT